MRHMQMLLASGALMLMIATTGSAAYAGESTANTVAQSGGLTDILTGGTPIATTTGAATPAVIATSTPRASTTLSPTTSSQTLTLTLPLTVAAALSDTLANTNTVVLTAVSPATVAPSPEGVVAGTVIANRTAALVRFFAEGNTYDLAALRSAGLALSRPSNVLNLYNCDASLGVDQPDCYWDPYLLQRDGFYEVVAGKDTGALKGLILRAAGTPPDNQVWVQNRAGRDEDIYYGTQMHTVPEGGVEQFGVEAGGVGVFYLRTCISTADGASACEWASHSAAPGAYYALVDESRPGDASGTTISNLELQPVLDAAPTAGGVAATATAEEYPQTVCKLAVPALNVRSGPGLSFDIVNKVRSTDVEVGTVIVTGRTSAGDWLRVHETVAPGGWVIAGSEYLDCEGDITALPVVAESELPATPTPLPPESLPADNVAPGDTGQPVDTGAVGDGAGGTPPDITATDGITETTAATATGSTATAALPIGTAMLTVYNEFDREVRFTLDQRYRLEQGASEFDLLPGESVNIIVFAGQVPFTASSPWQGLSGNTAIAVGDGEVRGIYLVFYYDEVDKKWYLAPV